MFQLLSSSVCFEDYTLYRGITIYNLATAVEEMLFYFSAKSYQTPVKIIWQITRQFTEGANAAGYENGTFASGSSYFHLFI